MALLNWLNDIDTQIFLGINGMHSRFFDAFFSLFTSKEIWFPFYLLLIILFYMKYGRKATAIVLILALAIVASDQLAGLIKILSQRFRPSHEPMLASRVHLTFVGAGGDYGFVSSHAANAFALAVFTWKLMGHRRVFVSLLFWALLTAYSRIYVGVHYPFDVLVGSLIGCLIGWGAFRYLKYHDIRFMRRQLFKNNNWKTTQTSLIPLVLGFIIVTLLVVAFLMLKYKIAF
jgi:undecaprenyl-diphosphatase